MKIAKSLKKGVVLVITSVILFIATSTVAILSTFVVVGRNQKLEHEYTSRVKIQLRSKAFDIFESFLLNKVPNLSTVLLSSLDEGKNVFSTDDAVGDPNNELKGGIQFTYHINQYTSKKYFKYEINTSDFGDKHAIHDKKIEATIITTVSIASTESNDVLKTASNYDILEMRFA